MPEYIVSALSTWNTYLWAIAAKKVVEGKNRRISPLQSDVYSHLEKTVKPTCAYGWLWLGVFFEAGGI